MKSKNNLWFWIVITIYVLITVLRVLNHQPWFDEAHAWHIAQEKNLLEVIQLMPVEGHTFIWYLLLMPFAKTNFHYPWPMFILNYTFALVSVIILWKKAPLHNITKTIITFSFPFFACLPVLARCYSIGVMLLFIILAVYKDRLKHPLIYSTLIILAANTSVMILFGAAAFGFMFAYDLIRSSLKNKISNKDFIVSFCIMALGAVLIMWQLGSFSKLCTAGTGHFGNNIFNFMLKKSVIMSWFSGLSFIFAAIVIFVCNIVAKNRSALFLYLFSLGGLLFCFLFVYPGWVHHFIFLYIYFLTGVWLLFQTGRRFIIAEILLAMAFLGFMDVNKRSNIIYFKSSSKAMAETILNDDKLRNSRIIVFDASSKRFLPYVAGKNIDIWDYCTGAPIDSSIVMNHNTPICTISKKTNYAPYIKKVMAKDKETYSIDSVLEGNYYRNNYIVEDSGIKILFELYKQVPESGYLFYKTTIIDN